MSENSDLALLPDPLRGKLPGDFQGKLAACPRGGRCKLVADTTGEQPGAILEHVAKAAGLDVLHDLALDEDSLSVLPTRLVHEYQAVPVAAGGKDRALHIASAWPPDRVAADWVATFTRRPVRWHLGFPEKINALIVKHYGVGSGSLEEDELAEEEMPAEETSTEADEEAAVVRFVSEVIQQAVTEEATDIHFEPQEDALRIRYRVDGILVPVPVPENLRRYQDAIISRLKIMAKLNISERRLPQDGRIAFKSGETPLDIRVSTIPTIYAESVSLRLLNQKKQAYSIDRLGLTEEEMQTIDRVLEAPHGIILVTGPTGSGKSTSLNAFLRRINSPDLRIITIEDPIEYELPGVNQMQVKAEIGLKFADALRHVLRQDPDVIMVGEIRDLETAEISIRSSLTGHLVLSTLHTNDAPGALTRLVDMGIEPYLVASSVEMVIAQRLVRRLCPECLRMEPVSQVKLEESLAILGLDTSLAAGVKALPAAAGCDHCRGTGFRGRVGIFEILRLDDDIHNLLIRHESARALTKCARDHGMRTLQQSGWNQVCRKLTTLEEVIKATTITG